MSQNQTPSFAAAVDKVRAQRAAATAAPDQAAIARFVNLDFSSGPMTDAWLQYQFDGALTVAKMRFGETEAGRAAVLRGFANRILLGQASAAEAALAVPFTENPAEPPAEAAP